MRVEITPSVLSGTLKAPPSKSMAHRMLICAGLSAGESVIDGISDSEDVRATLDCLSAMGASYRKEGDRVYLQGCSPLERTEEAVLPCRESGSTLRFLLPLGLMCGVPVTLRGTQKLLSRPLSVYETICRESGFLYRQERDAVTVCGTLQGREYKIPGNISSQFISGLLFALPLCREDSLISILPPIESRSYLHLTIEALRLFGITVTWRDDRTLEIKGGQRYRACQTTVEGDYSNAAFFAGLSLLGENRIEITGLSPESLQGDRAYIRYFEMLCKGTPTIHIGDCPDLGPVLMAVAAVKNGAVFCGTRRLKMKESDRGAAMAEELSKLGVCVRVLEDSIVVFSPEFHAPKEPLYGHNDHRIVMALSILLTVTGGVIEGAEAVKKSFPEFFAALQSIGGKVTLYDVE